MKNYLSIPIELIKFSLTKKGTGANHLRTLQIFLYVKFHFNDKVRIRQAEIFKITNALGIKSTKTTQKHINRLLLLNWLGFNPKTGVYFVRGFDNIRKQYRFKSKTAARLNLNNLNNFKDFKIFVCVLVIIELINLKKREHWAGACGKTALNSRSAKQPFPLPFVFPVSNCGLATMLNVSPTTASKIKRIAAAAGFIKITSDWSKEEINNTDISKTTIPRQRKIKYSELRPGEFLAGDKLIKRKPDLISLNNEKRGGFDIQFVTRKKNVR